MTKPPNSKNIIPITGKMFLYSANLLLVELNDELYLIATIVFDDKRFEIQSSESTFDGTSKQLKVTLAAERDKTPENISEILKPSTHVLPIGNLFNIVEEGEGIRIIDGEILVEVKKWVGGQYDEINPFIIRPSKVKRISAPGETRPGKIR